MLVGLRKIRAVTFLLSMAAVTICINHLWNVSVFSLSSYKSSVCSCAKCLTDGDPWFAEIIKSSPKPLLSGKSAISEEDFIWWKVNINLSFKIQMFFTGDDSGARLSIISLNHFTPNNKSLESLLFIKWEHFYYLFYKKRKQKQHLRIYFKLLPQPQNKCLSLSSSSHSVRCSITF